MLKILIKTKVKKYLKFKKYRQYIILKKFAMRLANNQKDLDPEINSIINKHFWDLF